MNREQAKAIVEKALNEQSHGSPDRLVVLDDATVEKSYGWVFFYESEMFLKTGELSHMLVGNAPILILKEDGRIITLGTAFPIATYLERYEQSGSPF